MHCMFKCDKENKNFNIFCNVLRRVCFCIFNQFSNFKKRKSSFTSTRKCFIKRDYDGGDHGNYRISLDKNSYHMGKAK